MKKKSEVFDHICHLYRLVKQETVHRIPKFRSDNGREYTDQRVQEFFNRKGIRQEFTAPYTPEQILWPEESTDYHGDGPLHASWQEA